MQPVAFNCDGTPMTGMVHLAISSDAVAPRDVGVVIVVGGPQTRVGSHRAFLKLAHALAARGYPTLRFDTRGMGDSHGDFPEFTNLSDDINAAVAQLLKTAPQVRRVVLWGLCDGASAILLGADQFAPHVSGYVLVNPWVHLPDGAGAAIAAQVQVKHYYAKRLVSGAFWKKLLWGGLNPFRAAGEFAATAKTAATAAKPAANAAENYIDGMRRGWFSNALPVLTMTSGDDLVAQEWLTCMRSPEWAKPRNGDTQTQHHAQANHTFSTHEWRKQVEGWTADWLDATLK